MGTFRAQFSIGDAAGQRWGSVEAVVYTGSSYSWIPRELLERLELRPQFRWQFDLADGSIVERDVAETAARYDG